MGSYFLSFSWGICILFSFVGWGSAINRILFHNYRIDWGQKAAWGIAFSIFVGGILNVTWAISKIVILVYLGMGFLCWLLDLFKTRLSVIGLISHHIYDCRKDKVVSIGIFTICFLAFLQYSGWVASTFFNPYDDFQTYFVFPEKMLQMGSIVIVFHLFLRQ